jgi:hypothetical protein
MLDELSEMKVSLSKANMAYKAQKSNLMVAFNF